MRWGLRVPWIGFVSVAHHNTSDKLLKCVDAVLRSTRTADVACKHVFSQRRLAWQRKSAGGRMWPAFEGGNRLLSTEGWVEIAEHDGHGGRP